jgi:hypothetical protein
MRWAGSKTSNIFLCPWKSRNGPNNLNGLPIGVRKFETQHSRIFVFLSKSCEVAHFTPDHFPHKSIKKFCVPIFHACSIFRATVD